MVTFGFNKIEVGLKLLLSPMGSKVVTRTACTSVGIALPVYSTYKAIESRDQNEQQKMLMYWAAYGCFTVVERFTDKFLFWIPYYYEVKLGFLIWLQFPSAVGARQLYFHHMRPFLAKQQAKLDKAVGFLRRVIMAKFVNSHQTVFRLPKETITKTLSAVVDVINCSEQQEDGGQPTDEAPTVRLEDDE